MKILISTFLLLSILTYTSSNNTLVAPAKYNGKYGFITTKGEWHIEPIFDSVGIFHNGFADFYQNGKQGMINNKGEIVIKPIYSFIGNFENERCLVMNNKNEINFIDIKGNLISKTYFEDGEDFSEDLAPVKIGSEGKWGYINTNGEMVIKPMYEHAYDFKNGLADVETEDSSYTINKHGSIIEAFKYSKPTKKRYNLIGSTYNSSLGFVNTYGDTIMAMKYISFGHRQNGLFWFNENKKYGLADTLGHIIVKPIFETISSFSDNGFAVAKKDGKYGYIDTKGRTVIDFQFDKADGFKHGLAAVRKKGKWGFINKKGHFVIKPKYENISYHFKHTNSGYELMYTFDSD